MTPDGTIWAPAGPQRKLLTREALVEVHGRPRSSRVVFTNGCFDLLHAGHVEYLHAARQLGDVLVVGLNSDRSVARLKGEGRPLVPAEGRALVLAGLESVDAVTIFDDDTPAALIGDLLPDILVKGGDYAPSQVVGRDVVEAAGGSVVIVPFVQGYSTTRIVARAAGGDPL